MTSSTVHNQKNKSSHSNLFSVFQRKKRQTSAPVAPQNEPAHSERPTTSHENFEDRPARLSKPTPQPLGFAQRLKLHKRPKNEHKQEEHVPSRPLKMSQSQTLVKSQAKPKTKKDSSAIKRSKAYSTDALNELDSEYLIEALLTIGDDQPTVARSIPKHAVLPQNARQFEERQRNNCIFEPEIYDKMLKDSLLVCTLLENHLTNCVKTVRAQSPLVGKKGAVNTGSFQEFLITATAPSTPSRSPATEHRSPLTISSASMSPLLVSSSPPPNLYRQKFLAEQDERAAKKNLIPVR